MKCTNKVLIDKEYFRNAYRNSGLTRQEFGETVGKTASFIHNTLDRGYMMLPVAKLLCKTYDLDIDKLILHVESPKPIEEPKPLMSDDKTLSALVETLNRVEKKLDFLFSELGC